MRAWRFKFEPEIKGSVSSRRVRLRSYMGRPWTDQRQRHRLLPAYQVSWMEMKLDGCWSRQTSTANRNNSSLQSECFIFLVSFVKPTLPIQHAGVGCPVMPSWTR